MLQTCEYKLPLKAYLAKKYFVIALVLSIFCIQIYHVHINHFSRWVGGGFGMYTGVHYSMRRIVLIKTVSGRTTHHIVTPYKSWEAFMFLSAPKRETAVTMLENLQQNFPEAKLVLTLWEPKINSRDHNAKYEKIFSHSI